MNGEADVRLLKLSNTIRTAIGEMMSDKMALKFRKKKITASEFSKRLFEILEVALKCEREQYVQELTNQLATVTAERDEARKQLQQERRKWARENSLIETDRVALQRKYEDLDGHYKCLGWRKDQKEGTYQEQIYQRDNTIRIMRRALTLSQRANQYLKNEVKELKNDFVKLSKANIRMLRSLRSNLNNGIEAQVLKEVNKQKKRDSKQLSSLATELKATKVAHDQLKGASQLLLDSVWNISPKRKGTPKVSLEDLPRKISEVHSFIIASVDDQKKIASEEIKRDLAVKMPELSATGAASVSEAISSVFQERMAEKDSEMAAKLKIVEHKEQKLRKKLEVALSQIQTMKQNQSHGSRSTRTPTQSYVDDFDDIRDDWEEQRRKLDMKMSELSRGMSSTLRVDSIFNSP